ncbi:hypothetical protein GCM10028777_30410 [Angustibacter speluncae]
MVSADLLPGTDVRVRAVELADASAHDPDAATTAEVLAWAVDHAGPARLVDHEVDVGHAHALLHVDDGNEVWRLRVAADAGRWVVAGAGCPDAAWPEQDHLVVDALGLPAGLALGGEPAGPDGFVLVDARALDGLVREGAPDALRGLTGAWAALLSRCAGAELSRHDAGGLVAVDCGPAGALLLGQPVDLEGEGRALVPVHAATHAQVLALQVG